MKLQAKARLIATVTGESTSVIAAVSNERIQQLKKLGYYVEDMGKEYGPDFKGQYRWMSNRSLEFQDDEESYSVAEAWAKADAHAKENGK
jgi:hypothetical protein